MTKRHGLRRSSEYRIWRHMRTRCENPNCHAYKDYGGRGIKVCDRWLDFASFYADMGPRPSGSHSIDRIDNSIGYSPENCRWATCKEQQRNRRDTRLVLVDGIKASLAEHCERLGLKYQTVHKRLTSGADIYLALSPFRLRRNSIGKADPQTIKGLA